MYQRNKPIEHRILEKIWELICRPFRKSPIRHSQLAINLDNNRTKWQEIEEMMKLGGPARFKQAVIEADKLLDSILKTKGFSGETMGDRLRSARSSMDKDSYNAAWEAHKVRNQIVHETEAEIMDYHAKKAIENYKKALNDLGAI